MKESELKALIKLLEDPDEDIYRSVYSTLMDQGESVIPALEHAWESTHAELIQARIESLIQDIHNLSVRNSLLQWRDSPNRDLLTGCLIIARYQYPDLDEAKIKEILGKLARDVWIEINDKLTALEKVKVINHILFHKFGLSGNYKNFYSPQNNFINTVLESKKGNPLTLSIIYSLVAQELKLPVYGVNLPKNFLLAYRDEFRSDETFDPELNDHILFYINPYSKGSVLGKDEIRDFLRQQKLQLRREFFIPCDNAEIILRLLHNLVFSYNKLGYQDKVVELEKLLQILKKEE